jgi:hypothetical protein
VKIRYIYPDDSEQGFGEVVVTREEAIRIQIEMVRSVRPDFKYQNEQQALDDYITVHWAEIIPDHA